jgi:hypothetical protein
MDDLPLVPVAPCSKIQKCSSRVLQLQKELERISASSPAGMDRLGLDPLVPLPDDQAFRFFLFHLTLAGLKTDSRN